MDIENINETEETAYEFGRIIRMSEFPASMKKSVAFNARNDAESLSKAGIDVLTLAGIITVAGVKAVTKEPCTNVYLVTDEGKAYFTQSDGIAASVNDMLDMFDNDVNGVVIRIVTRDTGNGRTRKYIRIMD